MLRTWLLKIRWRRVYWRRVGLSANWAFKLYFTVLYQVKAELQEKNSKLSDALSKARDDLKSAERERTLFEDEKKRLHAQLTTAQHQASSIETALQLANQVQYTVVFIANTYRVTSLFPSSPTPAVIDEPFHGQNVATAERVKRNVVWLPNEMCDCGDIHIMSHTVDSFSFSDQTWRQSTMSTHCRRARLLSIGSFYRAHRNIRNIITLQKSQ